MTEFERHEDLGALLLKEDLITQAQLDGARDSQRLGGRPISRVLVDLGLITDQAKMAFLSKKFGHEIVDIRDMVIPATVLTRLPRAYAEKHRCVPILIEGSSLVVAMEDPSDFVVVEEIRSHAGMDVVVVLAPVVEGVPKTITVQAPPPEARLLVPQLSV